jgi:hypothetical protein
LTNLIKRDSISSTEAFANIVTVSPEQIVIEVKEAGETPVRLICMNPKLINILAKIFQSTDMKYSFSGEKKGIVVFPFEDSGMFAILMPAYSEQLANRYLFY